MAGEYVIGVDVGTQGTKAALFRTDGTLMGEGFASSKLHRPEPGVVEEDPEDQVTAACEAISSCVETSGITPREVAAISVDGQMAGILAVGKDGTHVTPYDSWLDTRCGPYIERMEAEAGDAIVEKSGMAPSFNHGPKVLWWKNERPSQFDRIRAFVQPGSYVAMRLGELSGEDAYIDKTYLHFSGFADNLNNTWDEGLCAQFGVPRDKLPHIRDSHEIVGELSRNMAHRCALTSGVKIVAGCGDTAASFLSSGGTSPGLCLDVAGTASVFAATTTEFRPDLRQRTLAASQSAVPGLWNLFAYVNGGGMNLEWFRNDLLGSLGKECQASLGFAELERLAEKVGPESFFPIFVPHLAGRVTPADPTIRGAWVGLEWAHDAGHLYRALLEAVALEYGVYKEALQQLYPGFEASELRITGGGEQSVLWNEIKATTLQLPVQQVVGSKGAPMGAAMVAAYAVGLFESYEGAAGEWLKFGDRHEPNGELILHYRRKQKLYELALRSVSQFSREALRVTDDVQ